MPHFNPLFDKKITVTAASSNNPPLSPITGKPMVSINIDEKIQAWADLENRVVVPAFN